MTIKLEFEHPLAVSRTAPDMAQIKFLNPDLFVTKEGNQPIAKDEVTNLKKIPRLMKNEGMYSKLKSITQTMLTSATWITTANFSMNILLSTALSLLWGMVNSLQMIIHIPLLETPFPANAFMIYTLSMNFA